MIIKTIMVAQKNTYNKGTLHFMLYPTPEETFVAACQELCLIVEGKDQELLKYKIMAKAKTYIQNVSSKKLGKHLLNQELPKEILKEFNDYRIKKSNEDFQKWITNINELNKIKKPGMPTDKTVIIKTKPTLTNSSFSATIKRQITFKLWLGNPPSTPQPPGNLSSSPAAKSSSS